MTSPQRRLTFSFVTSAPPSQPSLSPRYLQDSPDNVSRSLRAHTQPDPYRANPFRVLGLPCLADTRETTRRIEALRIATELDAAAADWAFAPTLPLTAEAIRAAAQTLRDPLSRFICEVFWFWPLAYPATTIDPALQALAVGDTETATRLWSEAPAAQAPAALHNLAVYQHLLVLEWEEDAATDPAEIDEVRANASTYWRRLLGSEALPRLLAARLAALAEPQLSPALPTTLIAQLPVALARIHADLALRLAQRDRFGPAAAHMGLVSAFLPENAASALGDLLAETAAPLIHRLDTAVENIAAATPLSTATHLIRATSPDLARLQILLKPTSPAARAAARALVVAVLDAAVSHQRDGGADQLVLPHLLYLCDQPLTPELATRLSSTFNILQANAIANTAAPSSTARVALDPARRDREAAFVLIRDTLIPADRQTLVLPAPASLAYQARLADWTITLAQAAATQPDEIAWARATLRFAFTHSAARAPDADATARLRSALEALDISERFRLDLTGPANQFRLGPEGIALDGPFVPLDEIVAIQLSTDRSDPASPRTLLAWSSTATAEALYLDQLAPDGLPDPTLEAGILASLEYFLFNPLVERLAQSIEAGARLEFGALTLTREGLVTKLDGLFSVRIVTLAYGSLRVAATPAGHVLVTAPEHPKLHPAFDPGQVWNAALLRPLIARLAGLPRAAAP